MVLAEPINLHEWKVPDCIRRTGRLFTCGRPGRATHKRARVTVGEEIVDLWVGGLPQADIIHIVSLLGRKRDNFSEFSYYPFRSSQEPGAKPTFEEWLNNRYGPRFVVHEFPTVDARGVPPDVLEAAAARVRSLLKEGQTTVVIDSAGAERTARVCKAIGYKRVT